MREKVAGHRAPRSRVAHSQECAACHGPRCLRVPASLCVHLMQRFLSVARSRPLLARPQGARSVRARAAAAIDTMKMVKLGNSDLEVSYACLGTMVRLWPRACLLCGHQSPVPGWQTLVLAP